MIALISAVCAAFGIAIALATENWIAAGWALAACIWALNSYLGDSD